MYYTKEHDEVAAGKEGVLTKSKIGLIIIIMVLGWDLGGKVTKLNTVA